MHEEYSSANTLQKVNYLVLLKGPFEVFPLQNLLLQACLNVFENAVEEEGHTTNVILRWVFNVNEFYYMVGIFFLGKELAALHFFEGDGMIKVGGIAKLFEREESEIGFAFDDEEFSHKGVVLFFHLDVVEREWVLCFLSLISHKYKFDIFIHIVKLNIIKLYILIFMLQTASLSSS